jgi:hypothetical protein
MKELGRGSEPNAAGDKSGAVKVKSRASQPQVGGSKPSVPSLPSIQRTSTLPSAGASNSGAGPVPKTTGSKPGSKPGAGSKPGSKPGAGAAAATGPQQNPSRPNLTSSSRPPGALGAGMSMSGNFGMAGASTQQPPKSNALVFILIAILLAAIGVLAYLVLTK